ncbi:hypothetical protein [Catellatospora sp. TT07R-123]|uniref:hypothetical protein n=1 Tax=Catellatospora sp. TT07R-123 TaxID=2733863 RepID=UPI001BB3C373|nr:hypothetical protein [Catellatospora sp. TT07R-123]
MGYYGTWVLARSPDRLLVEIPEVKAAFGSLFWRLEDRGDGWQLARIIPNSHEWPRVGGGLHDLVAATDAPVLAAWVSESSCARVVAATPAGHSWSRHVSAYRGLAQDPCGFDHRRFATLRLAPGERVDEHDTPTPAADILTWARAAALPADRAAVTDVLASAGLNGHDRVQALVDAIGARRVSEIPRLFEPQEGDWWDAWFQGDTAGLRLCRRWTADGEEPTDWNRERPWDDDYLDFIDKVCASVYGTGMPRHEIVALARALDERWTAEMALNRQTRVGRR